MASNAGQAAAIVGLSQQDLNDAYSELLDDLNEAYWAAGTLEAKDKIKGYLDTITDTITALDAADLSLRDTAYDVLNTKVTTVNTQLQMLQNQISSLINRINTAASVVSDISKVVSIAARIFPGL
jgi:peptidoglycan hydrolase CwlO-like protein